MKKFNSELKMVISIVSDAEKYGYLKKYQKKGHKAPSGKVDVICHHKRDIVKKLLDNINTNRTACAVHKTLSREISRLNAEELVSRAQLCSWHDIWEVVASQNMAAMMAALHNPRLSVGQYKTIMECLPDGLIVIARQWR